MSSINNFYTQIAKSVTDNSFVRLTLSKNKVKQNDLKKVIFKLAIIKKELHFTTTFRHKTQDVTKNFLVDAGLKELQQLLNNQFLIANLFTITEDVSFEILKDGKEKLRQTKPTFTTVPQRSHDKQKKRLIDNNTNYLTGLGVLDAKGNILKDKGDKYKQINKFVEIIDGLLRQHPTLLKKESFEVVDMGAGKGYLTFALYDYLINTKQKKAIIKGVEIRPDLIKKCNDIAKEVGFNQLTFEEGYINDFQLSKTDVLIALHACDTATDDAIFKGIQAEAELIICAPCCHKQIRKQISKSENLQPILNYGILKERQAEIITDTIRALLLESVGYKTKVFEFISTEHTGKNVMIVGQKHNRTADSTIYLEKIAKLKKEFGIDHHYLEQLFAQIEQV